MKKIFFSILFLILLNSFGVAHAVRAIWNHSATSSVFKYKISWGTTQGTYPQSQEMLKSACTLVVVEGVTYDCQLILTGIFIDNTTYYFVGYAINYGSDGNEQLSPATPVVIFIKRADGNIGEIPASMTGLGIYPE
jgi:hypothetical protein